jgi:Raf kinase inhibitor-like YbhB/YbcL family protein
MEREGWGRSVRAQARGERRRVRGALVVGMVVLASVVAGCSSGDDTSTTSTSDGPSATVPGTVGSGASGAGTAVPAPLTLMSAAFGDGESIPVRHACVDQGGENASPQLAWSGVPEGTDSLVLVVHDPDAPRPGGFTHLVTTIPVDRSSVDEGANLSGEGPMARWIGPCPPSGEHHYVFTLYAFGSGVTLAPEPDKPAVDAVAGEALATAELTGLFAHQG